MDTTFVLSAISVIGTVSSIVFAYLAFSRSKYKDIKDEVSENTKTDVDLATIKIDLKYMRDGVDRIEKRFDDYERIQGKILDRLARLEEHQTRVDSRLDKLEQKKTSQKKNIKKGESRV